MYKSSIIYTCSVCDPDKLESEDKIMVCVLGWILYQPANCEVRLSRISKIIQKGCFIWVSLIKSSIIRYFCALEMSS